MSRVDKGNAMNSDETLDAAIRTALAEPLLRQESGSPVYAARCPEGCNRVYVGVDRPLRCGVHPDADLLVQEIT